MKEYNINNSVNRIVSEFQDSDIELAKALLKLRRNPSSTLKNRIRNIPFSAPVITTHLSYSISAEKGKKSYSKPILNIRLVISAFCVLLFLISIFAIPSAQAQINKVLQFFGLVLIPSNEAESILLKSEPLSDSEELNEERIGSFSPEELENILRASPPVPSWLPQHIELGDIKVGSGAATASNNAPLAVIVSYRPSSSSSYPDSAGIGLQVTYAATLEGGYSFPIEKAQNVMVNDNPAIFVRGAWVYKTNNSQSINVADLVWSDEADSGHLSWSADGFIFNLSASGLELTLDEFLRIAESIH